MVWLSYPKLPLVSFVNHRRESNQKHQQQLKQCLAHNNKNMIVMHKRLLVFSILVLQMQSFSSSEAEDFNPLDHIIPNQKRGVDPISEDVDGTTNLHQNERCRCTCPGEFLVIFNARVQLVPVRGFGPLGFWGFKSIPLVQVILIRYLNGLN